MLRILTAFQYNQNAGSMESAEEEAFVIIAKRGKPAPVLMTIAAYEGFKENKLKLPLVAFLEGLDLSDIELTREADVGRGGPI